MTTHCNRIARWKTRPNVESLEERSLMSASPLSWTAPAGNTPNDIAMMVNRGLIEILDNGKVVASQNVADTSSITITTGARVPNSVTILSTPQGLQTTINLKGVGDSVFIGDTGDRQVNVVLLGNTVARGAMTTVSLGGTRPTVAAATMENILGAVKIAGIAAAHDSVVLGDSLDTGSHRVIITGRSVTGLAPAAVTFTGITNLEVDGSKAGIASWGFNGTIGGMSRVGAAGGSGQSSYLVSGAAAHTYLMLEGMDSVSVTSVSGAVNVFGGFRDTAFLQGPATGVNTLTAGPGGATLRGAGYVNQVSGFTYITVSSRSALDTAVLNGASGDGNTLTATLTDAVLTHGLDQVEAVNFHTVNAHGTGAASDVANITGPTSGKSGLILEPDNVILASRGFILGALEFTKVNAYSKSATDSAVVYGYTNGGNTLIAAPTYAIMEGTGYHNVAYNFPSIIAYGSGAGDISYLSGTSTGTNTLVASPNSTAMTGAGYTNTAMYFGHVYAYSNSADDVANLNGRGSYLYATPTVAQLSGTGYFVQTANFPTTYEHVTAETFELTSAGALLGQTVQTAVAVVQVVAAVRPAATTGLQTVGTSWVTVDTAFQQVAVGSLLNPNYVWDINATGVHIFGATPSGTAISIALTLQGLADSNLRSTVVQSMVRDGALDHAAMLDAFNTVEEKAPTLQAATMQDLQFLLRCAATLQMPDYVADLADSVLNGQEANATLRGLDSNGNVVKAALGNLHVGSSSSQLAGLVDMWFLGVDEPDALTPYEPVTGSLFLTSGPNFKDVVQGKAGDCWLMASMAEIAARDPGYLTSMFTYVGLNTVNGATVDVYTVRFYDKQGVARYLTVDTELPGGGGTYDHPQNNVLWAALLEKAYAQASGAGWVRTDHDDNTSYNALTGGWPSFAIPALTNLSTYEHDIDASAAAKAFQAGDLVCFCTGDSPHSSEIVPNHCYALVAYDPSTSSPFKLYNPWGTDSNGIALSTLNNRSVWGLFDTTASFINSNFNHNSIADTAPDHSDATIGDNLTALLEYSRTGATAQRLSMDQLLYAIAEAERAGHAHNGLAGM
jgi:hypothetical protein